MIKYKTNYLTLLLLILSNFVFSFQDIENPITKWKFKTEGTIRGAVNTDSTNVYFGSSDGYVYALNKFTGNLQWKFKTDGAVAGKPEIQNSTVFISSRDGKLYAIGTKKGDLKWSFKMGEQLLDKNSGWKYGLASPKIYLNNILMGSGDGNLYSINIFTGKLVWKFRTKGRIRATPLIFNKKIYQPSNDGFVYVLNFSGKLEWKFKTKGVAYNKEGIYNFDRSSIIAQPLIKDSILVIASRDGNTYGIDIVKKEKKWNFTYGNTWAMATEIFDNTVYVAWSTNDIFSALDLYSGEEKWKIKTGAHNFTKPIVTKSNIYLTSADSKFYKLDKTSGSKIWEYELGDEIYSSPTYDKLSNTIFFGCDDGYLYALGEGEEDFKAVYQPYKENGKFKNPKASKQIVPYLKEKGFTHIYSSDSLYTFIEKRIKDNKPSVIVFSHLVIPDNVLGEEPQNGLIRTYLESGGKVIWPGGIPNFYKRNKNGEKIRSALPATKLLDVKFSNAETGVYYSKTTQEAKNIGYPSWTKTLGVGIEEVSEEIIPLAYNEFNKITAWYKRFNSKGGYYSFRTWGNNVLMKDSDLQYLYNLSINGLK